MYFLKVHHSRDCAHSHIVHQCLFHPEIMIGNTNLNKDEHFLEFIPEKFSSRLIALVVTIVPL